MKGISVDFFYIHGFNSTYLPDNPKLEPLKSIGDVTGISYDTFAYPSEIEYLLESSFGPLYMDKSEPVLVGTSLGGYWALRLGEHYDVPVIIINPSLHPSTTLKRYLGESIGNYSSGETKILDNNVVEAYRKIVPMSPTLCLLDKGDNVIPYDRTKSELEHHSNVKIVTFENGSHRFDHMQESLPHIESFVNRFYTTHR